MVDRKHIVNPYFILYRTTQMGSNFSIVPGATQG